MVTEKDIKLAQQGNSEAFTRIYNETIKTAYYVAKRILVDEQAVEDILQESYIAVYEHLGDYKAGNFQGWVDTIVANRAKNYLRKANPLLFSQMESEDNPIVEFEEEKIEFRPEESVDYNETKRLVMNIIDELAPDQRLATILFYFEQRSVKEIAEICECSENTIKSRLNYARKKIKEEVLELEKKGTKLYCAPIVPFLYWMFRQEAMACIVPAATKVGVTSAMAQASSQTAASATGQTAAQGAATKTGMALGTKIAIGATAATLAIGGAIASMNTVPVQEQILAGPVQYSPDIYKMTIVAQAINAYMAEEEIDYYESSSEKIPDELKEYAFYMTVSEDEFQTKLMDPMYYGYLMNVSEYDGQNYTVLSLDQYIEAQSLLWSGGISKDEAQMHLDEMVSEGGHIFDDGTYAMIDLWGENTSIVKEVQTYEHDREILIDYYGEYALEGQSPELYHIVIEGEMNDISPFASMTITDVTAINLSAMMEETGPLDGEKTNVTSQFSKEDMHLINSLGRAIGDYMAEEDLSNFSGTSGEVPTRLKEFALNTMMYDENSQFGLGDSFFEGAYLNKEYEMSSDSGEYMALSVRPDGYINLQAAIWAVGITEEETDAYLSEMKAAGAHVFRSSAYEVLPMWENARSVVKDVNIYRLEYGVITIDYEIEYVSEDGTLENYHIMVDAVRRFGQNPFADFVITYVTAIKR